MREKNIEIVRECEIGSRLDSKAVSLQQFVRAMTVEYLAIEKVCKYLFYMISVFIVLLVK